MLPVPAEINFGGVYFSPLFLSGILGVLAAWATATALNRVRLSRFVAAPPLAFLAMGVIFTGFISTFVFPG